MNTETSVKCAVPTRADSRWPYHQYYIGDEDQEQRRDGRGENHWSGAESLEWYNGSFLRDTMHGEGEYRWRYKGLDGSFITYEGKFYGNRMHGYGVMSYPDGRVFSGLFYNNMRWGPGIESNTKLQQNVGLWRGNQLIRLSWRPSAPSVALDFNFGSASLKNVVEAHRTLLATNVKDIGTVNSAIELLKQNGADPVIASEKWSKLYPKHCNDLASQVCHVALFDHKYYNTKVLELDEVLAMPISDEEGLRNSTDDGNNDDASGVYYSWNNSETLISMMKHCFKHEPQRNRSDIQLMEILSGIRTTFKRAGKHELNCRVLIMSSYLGFINRVAQLINTENVHPDVADILGNTALMYATCGDRADIIHFLVEAGADVNSFNDSCCTPLSVALLRYACLSKDISTSGMVQALSPPPQPFTLPLQKKPSEWHITRELPTPNDNGQLTQSKASSKSKLSIAAKKSTTMAIDGSKEKRKTLPDLSKKRKSIVADLISPNREMNRTTEERRYDEINAEYLQEVSDLFSMPGIPIANYLFEVLDMATEIDAGGEEHKDKKGRAAVTKEVVKPSPDPARTDSEKEGFSLSSEERLKIEMLDKVMLTIVRLLLDGADPRLVRCTQPALFIAVVSGSSDLVWKLVQYGADINETYPDALNYTVLDMAVSKPLTQNNLTLVRTILECGGSTDHRLKYESGDEYVPGPTLLHAVLSRNIEDSAVQEICCQLLELLLNYGCSAVDQFHGCSATDVAMAKGLRLFDVFINNPKTDLNAVINEYKQTILMKMFSIEFFRTYPITERLQTLTNLMLYGADPLLECQNRDATYENILVFAKKTLREMEGDKPQNTVGTKSDAKVVKKKNSNEKPKKEGGEKSKEKQKLDLPKPGAEDIADYKQALCLMQDCARILHVRWIQAKLMKDLLKVVEKFEHRHWNMILPEHKRKVPCGLWLTMPRCLEIWVLFKGKKKKKYNDRRILKHLLCMVHFYSNRSTTTLKWPLTAEEKGTIETEVVRILYEHKITVAMASVQYFGKPFVTPELEVGAEKKFQVCFECAFPLPEDKITCNFCKQVSFCSLDCMKINVEQNGSIHPCSQNLRYKYFPTPEESLTNVT